MVRRNTMKQLSHFASRLGSLAVGSALGAVLLLSATAGLAQNSSTATEGCVVLPVNEYRALRRAAFPTDAEPLPPPVDATLTRIDYDLKVEGELASGEAR